MLGIQKCSPSSRWEESSPGETAGRLVTRLSHGVGLLNEPSGSVSALPTALSGKTGHREEYSSPKLLWVEPPVA